MRRTVIVAVSALLALSACDTSGEPSAPPTGEDALTTATAEPAPVDDVEVTTEAEVTTEEPSEEAAPELPDEAKQFTEEGAEEFALHYIDLVNHTGISPETGLLEPLAAGGCKSCENHEESVAYGVDTGEHLRGNTFEPGAAQGTLTGEAARVEVPVEQPAQSYVKNGEDVGRKLERANATLVFRLTWDGGWTVTEITVA